MEAFALDCSATVSFFFKDEYSALTDSAFEALSDYAQAWVPSLWPLEVANACLIAERKKRIRIAQIWEILTIFDSFPIQVESALSPTNVREIVTLAQKHELTSYDAAYLELAIRRSIPLVTLDKKLIAAAQSENARLWTMTL